jgi:hypothetical protein
MITDVQQLPEPMENEQMPRPGHPSPELNHESPTGTPADQPSPELIDHDDQHEDGDKQSDLNVPGGKGLVHT